MEQFGTMRDGIIVPDEPSAFQEGERIAIQPVETDLRGSCAEMKAGKASPYTASAHKWGDRAFE